MLKKWRKQCFYTAEDMIKLWLMLALLSGFGAFLVAPLCVLFFKAFFSPGGDFVGLGQFVNYFASPNLLLSFINTVYISVAATVIAVTLAFLFAYALTRRQVPCKKIFHFIAMLPIFAPTMLFGMALIYLFGNQGLLTHLGFKISLYGHIGIIISEVIYCFPVALMILLVAFSAADNRLYEAAEVMGTGRLRKLLTITLPSIKYGLISACFVCFTYSFTDFGAPSVVGGNFNVLATDIYKQVIGQQNFNMGAVVGLLMMIPTLISFVVDRFIAKKQASSISSRAIPYQVKPNRVSDGIATVFCTVISIFLLGFFSVAFFSSLATAWPYNLQLTFSHYDFSHIALGAGELAIKNSLLVAVFVAIFGTIIAFVMAYLVEKVNVFPKVRQLLYLVAITPMAIPGTVIGLAYVLFFNAKTFPLPGTTLELVNGFNFLYGTLTILIVVNIIHYFSVPFVTALTALKRMDREIETVSDSLNVPFYRTFLKITIPMSYGAILEMMAYFFMNSMITVSAVIFLYTPLNRLISIVILNVNGVGDDAEAAALCMAIFMINIMVRFMYEALRFRLTKKTELWLKR